MGRWGGVVVEKIWRIIDAELNRVTEGLRVLEDLTRFVWEQENFTIALKAFRGKLANLLNMFRENLLQNRDSLGDCGVEISQKLQLDKRHQLGDIATANWKRVQEGLRSLEEYLKLLNYYEHGKEIELLRFQSYTLEKEFFSQIMISGRRLFPATDLYCLTAQEFSLGRSNMEVVKELLAAQVKLIQYREKELNMKSKYQEALVLREMTAAAGATLIINDDLHLALAVEADGLHLGQNDLPIAKARELLKPEMFLGLSTHSPQQANAAVEAGVDYIGVGPIFRTFTKKDVCEPVGLEYLDYVVGRHQIPFVAIGGIKENNLAEVIKRGARCLAMVTEIVGAVDIGKKIASIREKILKIKECT